MRARVCVCLLAVCLQVCCAIIPVVYLFVLMVEEGAWEDWCLIGTCCRDLLLPVSERITSSHPAQSYCLAVSQSL